MQHPLHIVSFPKPAHKTKLSHNPLAREKKHYQVTYRHAFLQINKVLVTILEDKWPYWRIKYSVSIHTDKHCHTGR